MCFIKISEPFTSTVIILMTVKVLVTIIMTFSHHFISSNLYTLVLNLQTMCDIQ